MSDGTINLLRNREKAPQGEKRTLTIVRSVSVALLFIVFVYAVVLFVLRFTSELPKLKRQEQTLLTQLSALEVKRAKYAFVNDRIKNISEILLKRPHLEKYIDTIMQELPQSAGLDELKIEDKTIELIINSPSLVDLGAFLDNMVGIVERKKLFTNVSLDSLTVSENGNYVLTLKANTL